MNPNPSYIFDKVKELALELGFSDAGYAAIAPLHNNREHFERSMEAGYFAELGYLKRNIEKREDPRLIVDGARSVLVFLAPYGKPITCESDEYINICATEDNAAAGDTNSGAKSYNAVFLKDNLKYKVAQYALGEDYHTVIRGKLNTILEQMKSMNPSISGRVFTDTAPVLERAWAVQAGLGFIGKNNFFISREHGIRNFIGVIISNFEIHGKDCATNSIGKGINCNGNEITEKKYCGKCTRCIEACPTGALSAPYALDARRCTSYLTIESREATPERNIEMASQRGGWIFGCDACMNACPWNSRNKPGWQEFVQSANPLPLCHLKRR